MKSGEKREDDRLPLLESDSFIQKTVPPNPGWGCRHFVVFMVFLGMCNIYAMRVNLSVALVAMVRSPSSSSFTRAVPGECPADPGAKAKVEGGDFDWSPDLQGLVLSAFFYGYITTQLAGGWVAENFGAHKVFGLGIFATALFTLLTPLAAHTSVYLLIAVRVLMGIGEGVTYPAMYVCLSKWSPPLERTKFMAFVIQGGNLGTVISQPISGLLADYGFSGGWPSIFYVFGSLGCIWVLAWILLVYEDPQSHPGIRLEEKTFIMEAIGDKKKQNLDTPWRAILTSPPVLALAVALFAKNWGYNMLLTTLPTYMGQVLKFNMSRNGFYSSLPYLCQWFMGNVSGQVADMLRSWKLVHTTVVRKVANTLGCLGPALFLVLEGYVGCDQMAAVGMLMAACGFLGVTSAGCMVNHLDIAPRYSGTLMGLTNTVAAVAGIVAPSMVEGVTGGEHTPATWRIVFYITSAIYVVGALVYIAFGSGREQIWAKEATVIHTRYVPEDFSQPPKPTNKEILNMDTPEKVVQHPPRSLQNT